MRRIALRLLPIVSVMFASHGCFAMCARNLGKGPSGYQQIQNTCNYPISFHWYDQGACNGTGCGVYIRPQAIEQTTGMVGNVRAAECEGRCVPKF